MPANNKQFARPFKAIVLLWLFAEYRRVPEAFIPDENYRCWPSYHHKGCLLSVFDVNEAIEICDSYSQCKAFVLTNQTTWTGRSWVLLKGTPTFRFRQNICRGGKRSLTPVSMVRCAGRGPTWIFMQLSKPCGCCCLT